MNIFYLDHNPVVCAEQHNDKHCVKMILEYAQLMSTTHRLVDRIEDHKLLYKATHVNHPSTIWTRQNASNYNWLYNLFESLAKEYTYRYDKHHKSYLKLKDFLCSPPANLPGGDFTQPTPAMPDYCKVPGDSLASYRYYYRKEKGHLATWKKRSVPEWYYGENCNV